MSDAPVFFAPHARVSVLTTQPLDRLLTYRAPEGGCHLGAFVEVPLGPRKVLGVVWGPGQGDYDLGKIRAVIRVLDVAPMRENVTIEDVGNSAVFLASDMSSHVTGEVLYVDSGFNIMGVQMAEDDG